MTTPITYQPGPGDSLAFFTCEGAVFTLSNKHAPEIECDRDRAVLRALMKVAKGRLDYYEATGEVQP